MCCTMPAWPGADKRRAGELQSRPSELRASSAPCIRDDIQADDHTVVSEGDARPYRRGHPTRRPTPGAGGGLVGEEVVGQASSVRARRSSSGTSERAQRPVLGSYRRPMGAADRDCPNGELDRAVRSELSQRRTPLAVHGPGKIEPDWRSRWVGGDCGLYDRCCGAADPAGRVRAGSPPTRRCPG